MAAVYIARGGREESDDEGLSYENNQAGTKRVVAPALTNAKKIKVEESGWDEDHSNTEPTPPRHHTEAAAMDVAPAITIKEERIEDDEYIQIKLGSVGESLEESTENNESERDNENADASLRSMRCQDCGQKFIRWEAFKVHLRQHEDNEEQKGKKRPLSHGRKKNKEGPRNGKGDGPGDDNDNDDEVCFASAWEIKASDVFEVHPRVAMPSEEGKPVYSRSRRVYACSVCGKVYSYLESLRNHQKMHEDKQKEPQVFPCLDCGKVFSCQSNFCVHLKLHKTMEVSSNFKCEQCNKTFNSLQTWVAHRDIHRRKPYWCLSCAKGFKDAKGLDRHLLGHNLKRHKCDLCPKTFRVPAELRYHRNTHTGAKPYKCQLCMKTFSQLGNLITHRKKHVGVYREGSEIPIRKYSGGRRRVTELKKLIVMGIENVEEAKGEEGVNAEGEMVDEEESEGEAGEEEGVEMRERVEKAIEEEEEDEEEGELLCFECGSCFSEESELHLHYMKHASGEL
ncbi:hypothetical protein MATL_G00126600 [Megalops atlanticus]|uniref:C2H2-type domain-containing protein n=1 Tax=Megalops atlanticus TaxID=7932 RepID=A0A9D3T4A3_MEGAT|nr:hypothetical protein MATL_G00126600 [Megalops atlanticus]